MIIILAFPLISDGAHMTDLSTLKLEPLFLLIDPLIIREETGSAIILVSLVVWNKLT